MLDGKVPTAAELMEPGRHNRVLDGQRKIDHMLREALAKAEERLPSTGMEMFTLVLARETLDEDNGMSPEEVRAHHWPCNRVAVATSELEGKDKSVPTWSNAKLASQLVAKTFLKRLGYTVEQVLEILDGLRAPTRLTNSTPATPVR